MIVNIPLTQIKPNPWQTRLVEPDPEYIRELALDIQDPDPFSRAANVDTDLELSHVGNSHLPLENQSL